MGDGSIFCLILKFSMASVKIIIKIMFNQLQLLNLNLKTSQFVIFLSLKYSHNSIKRSKLEEWEYYILYHFQPHIEEEKMLNANSSTFLWQIIGTVLNSY